MHSRIAFRQIRTKPGRVGISTGLFVQEPRRRETERCDLARKYPRASARRSRFRPAELTGCSWRTEVTVLSCKASAGDVLAEPTRLYSARSAPRAKKPASRKPIVTISPPMGSAHDRFPPNARREAPHRGLWSLVAPLGQPGHRPRHGPNAALTWPAFPTRSAFCPGCACTFAESGRMSQERFVSDGRTVCSAAGVGVGNHLPCPRKVPKRPAIQTVSRTQRDRVRYPSTVGHPDEPLAATRSC